jgi:uncharacterized membrane protein
MEAGASPGQEVHLMDRMLVVVFDTEDQAYEGKKALLQLNNESIVLYRYALIAKKGDGTVGLIQSDDTEPLGAVVGTALGSLIGLLGGPVGLAIGATLGLVAGGAVDLNSARIDQDFLIDVTKALTPGKFALVAEIQESWTTPLDIRMESIGGTVLRRAISDVKKEVDEGKCAAMKADLAELKAEHAIAHADRKAKLQDKINQLDSKIQAYLEKAKERRLAAEREAQAKAEQLQAKASALKVKAKNIQV